VRLSDENRARLDAACEKGDASVWVSGSDPGFITETLPMALLSVQRRVDLIEIEEFGDLSRRPSANMVMEQMRFGKPLSEFDPERRKNHLFGEYQPPLSLLADIAGFDIDEWTAEGGVAAAKKDLQIVAGEIKAGTAARAADRDPRSQRWCRPDPVHPVRLRRARCRARLGPAADGVARPHPRRRAV
jgi:4-hydroxy-tetrahydrodipicolinate reductase